MTEPSPTKKPRVDSHPAADEDMIETDEAPCTAENIASAEKRTRPLLSVPFVYPYEGGEFYYERECYDEYYNLVEGLLRRGKQCVTVTGSPGIGKSVFYAYFADRYLRAHPEGVWIIAGAYPEELEKVAIFRDDGTPPSTYIRNTTAAVDAAAEEAETKNKRVLFLWDGPPPRRRADGQSVVFTSPNERWQRATHKLHCTYYMPLWTREELHKAAHQLRLKTEDKVIDERFHMFGGAARYCLHPDSAMVDDEVVAVCAAISHITNQSQLEALIIGSETTTTRHRLLHYKPNEDNRRIYTTDVASPFIGKKLADQMLKLSARKREKVRSWLEGLKDGSALRGWIFEAETHHALCRGCRLHLRPLWLSSSSTAETETVALEKTADTPVEFEEVTYAMAARGPYHKPKAKNFESIDSFYIPNTTPGGNVTKMKLAEWNKIPDNRLLLFQITVSETHDVKAAGLIHVLNHLGLIENVVENLARVALVFVVPRANVASFQRQKITEAKLKGSGGLTAIPGIGVQTAADLKGKLQIENLGMLQEAMLRSPEELNLTRQEDRDWWAKICDLGLKHGLKTPNMNYSDVFVNIPQYVCSWEDTPVETRTSVSISRENEELKQEVATLRAKLQSLVGV